jgi:VCBS repeat-containing protein
VWVGGDGRYAIQSNWDLNWQPSKYDTVQVNLGTATIDAVGQHAGTLQIAAGATVKLTAGADLVQRFAVRAFDHVGREIHGGCGDCQWIGRGNGHREGSSAARVSAGYFDYSK